MSHRLIPAISMAVRSLSTSGQSFAIQRVTVIGAGLMGGGIAQVIQRLKSSIKSEIITVFNDSRLRQRMGLTLRWSIKLRKFWTIQNAQFSKVWSVLGKRNMRMIKKYCISVLKLIDKTCYNNLIIPLKCRKV